MADNAKNSAIRATRRFSSKWTERDERLWLALGLELARRKPEILERVTSGSGGWALWRRDPVRYVEEFLKIGTITAEQKEILRSVAKHRRVVCKAGHATGKTMAAALLACWWYDCWPEHICYITAPTWRQAQGLALKQVCLIRQERGLPGDVLESGIVRDPDKTRAMVHYIRAINAERGEGVQGEHSAPILIILEEAAGVPPYIWRAVEGLMTVPENRLLAIGNPTDEETEFGVACSSNEWKVITLNGMEHPNIVAELTGQEPPCPRAIRLQWVREMMDRHCRVIAAPQVKEAKDDTFPMGRVLTIGAAGGPDDLGTAARRVFWFPSVEGVKTWYEADDEFCGRILGEFSLASGTRVIPIGWVRACIKRELKYDDGLPYQPIEKPIAGLDLGESANTLVIRRGAIIHTVKQWAGNIDQAVMEAIDLCLLNGVETLIYDLQGPGMAVKEILKKRYRYDFGAKMPDIRIFGANVGAAVDSAISLGDRRACEAYGNLRAYIWHGIMRERCRKSAMGGYLPGECLTFRNEWLGLVSDLAKPLIKPREGRIWIESKGEMTVRGVESPHYGDALALTFVPLPKSYVPTTDPMDYAGEIPKWLR